MPFPTSTALLKPALQMHSAPPSPTASREHGRGAAFTPQRRSAGERLWTDPRRSATSTALLKARDPIAFRGHVRQLHLASTTGARRSRRSAVLLAKGCGQIHAVPPLP